MTGPTLPTLHALAWRPFIDPIGVTSEFWWALLVPLAFGVAVAYKAVRIEDLKHYWTQVLIMTVQIVVAIVGLGLATYLFLEVYVRLLAH